VLGGRLALNLGAPRLRQWLHIAAWRNDPQDPDACYYFGRWLLERRGPLAAFKFQASAEFSKGTGEQRADWFALGACAAVKLRDFDHAERWLARAEAAAPDRPWICIERARLLEAQDRYEDALAAARRSLGTWAWYPPGVQCVAHLLVLLNR